MRISFLSAVLATAILSGCANQGTPLAKVPLIDLSHSGLSTEALPAISATWWQVFHDPLLNQLMQQSLDNAPSLVKAQARIDAIMAQVQGSESVTKPQLNAQTSVTRSELSERGQMGAFAGGVPINTFSLGLQGRWTFDFWGKYAAQTRSVLGAKQAAELGKAQARLLLSQAVFTAYSQWQALTAVKDNLTTQIRNQQRIHAILRQRAHAGLLAQAQTYPSALAIEQLQSQQAKIDGQIATVRHALAALSGQQPYALDKQKPNILNINHLPKLPLTTITLNLLGRRPDILAAKALVESQQAAVEAARAAFYPDIRFSAMLGLESISGGGTAMLPYRSFNLAHLLSASARQWSIGPALSLPIFEGGALRANLRGQEATYNETVAAYNETVLNAFRDSANAISAYQTAEAELRTHATALTEATKLVSAQQKRATAGLDTPLTALQTTAQKLSIENEQIQAIANLQTAYGQVLSAIGGAIY